MLTPSLSVLTFVQNNEHVQNLDVAEVLLFLCVPTDDSLPWTLRTIKDTNRLGRLATGMQKSNLFFSVFI